MYYVYGVSWPSLLIESANPTLQIVLSLKSFPVEDTQVCIITLFVQVIYCPKPRLYGIAVEPRMGNNWLRLWGAALCVCGLLYRRSGFDCEILLITNCEFLYKTQSKESQEKEYAMNNITCDHTPFTQARVLKRSQSQTCMHSQSHMCLICFYTSTYSSRINLL